MKKILLAAAFVSLWPVSAMAQQAEYLSAQILSSQTGTMGADEIDMGLKIDLKDGWYTYWKMPGDSGLAPTFDWSESKNVESVNLSWPVPERFSEMDMNSFGYKDSVLFPIAVKPVEAGQDITLHLKAEIMVCKNICIPQTLTMMRVFRGGPSTHSEHYALIQQANKNLPQTENTENFSIDTVVLGKDGVVVTARASDGWNGETDVIVETPNGLLTAAPQIITQESDPNLILLKVPAPEGLDLATALFGKSVTVLVVKNGKAIEKAVNF